MTQDQIDNMLLFIQKFLDRDYDLLWGEVQLVLLMWAIVLAAVVIDLVYGVRKAKRMGIARTSYGLRRTLTKIIQYYSVLCFAFMFDLLSSLVFSLPYFTMLACIFLVFIEAKSVYEKAEDKAKKKAAESITDLITLLENKDDLVKGLAEVMKNQKKKEPDA